MHVIHHESLQKVLCFVNLSKLPETSSTHLVLEQPQRTLDDNVLEDGTRRNVDGGTFGCHNNDSTLEGNTTAQVDGTSDGKMVKLDNLGDRRDARLEAGNLLEIAAELDERGRAKSIGVDDEPRTVVEDGRRVVDDQRRYT